MTEDIGDIVNEARDTFDLKARIQNRGFRTGKLTVFTDEKTGAEHVEVLAQIEAVKEAAHDEIKVAEAVILPATKLDTKLLAKLEARRAGLEKELDRTALTFEWRAVPQIVVEQAQRRAREAAKGSDDDSKIATENAYFVAWLLHNAVTKYTDHESGESSTALSIENARALKDFLPPYEMLRLNQEFDRTQFANSIQLQAVDTPDF